MPTVEQLEAMVKQFPGQPFPRYGLALELRKLGRTGDALAAFAALLADHPSYVPQYQMYARTLMDAGRAGEAKTVLEAGIAVAGKAGDGHAKGEMEGLLLEIGGSGGSNDG